MDNNSACETIDTQFTMNLKKWSSLKCLQYVMLQIKALYYFFGIIENTFLCITRKGYQLAVNTRHYSLMFYFSCKDAIGKVIKTKVYFLLLLCLRKVLWQRKSLPVGLQLSVGSIQPWLYCYRHGPVVVMMWPHLLLFYP